MRWARRRTARANPRRPGWRAFLAAFWPFILGSLLVAGGLAAIVLGYLGVAGTLAVGLQLPYLVSGGVLGIALVVLGSALIVLHALNRQATLSRRILEELRSGRGPAATAGDGAAADGGGSDGFVVATRGGRLFHRPGCTLVAGKQVRRLQLGGPATSRLAPCRLCDPVPAS